MAKQMQDFTEYYMCLTVVFMFREIIHKCFRFDLGNFKLCHTLKHDWRASPWIGRPIAFVVNCVCTLLRALGILLDTIYLNLMRITLLWLETLPVLCLSINRNLLEKLKIWSRVSYLLNLNIWKYLIKTINFLKLVENWNIHVSLGNSSKLAVFLADLCLADLLCY